MKIINIVKSEKGMSLLEIFFETPAREFYQAELTRKTGFSKTTIIKWLVSLEENLLLYKRTEGLQKYYKLNSNNPVVKQIKVLFTVSKLYNIAKQFKNENMEMYLFGSAARGEDAEKSDIDILIIGKIEKKKLIDFVNNAGRITKKQVKPIVYTPLEYSNIIRKDRIFYENIEKNKIKLI